MTKPILSRVLLAGFAALAFLFIQAVPARPAEVPAGGILIFAAHPDDDIILAAGIANQAAGNVTIAFMTNGDRCDDATCTTATGTARQGEAVAAQELLGQAESDLIFLGYPNGYLNSNPNPPPPVSETYASRGLGSTDWYDYRTGGTGAHAPYNQASMQADVVALIDTYRPVNIYTHTRFDRHQDHQLTYEFLVQAVATVQAANPTYQPYIHSAIVHTLSKPWGSWPDSSGPTVPHTAFSIAENCSEGWPQCDTNGEYVWDQRETYVVPASMQNPNLTSNLKSRAVEAHASQVPPIGGDDFIRRFVRKDEVFWVERVGTAEGKNDFGYAVDEGATLDVAASGVLKNDVRGVAATAGQVRSATALGPMSAVLVSNPSNGSVILNADGSFTYIHNGSETLADSFTYRPVQGVVAGSVATVSLTINPVDDDPTAIGDGPYDVDNAALLTVGAPGVLGNDSDPEMLALSAVLVGDVSNGKLLLNADGSFTYAHDGSGTESDSFTYQVRDPGGNLSGVVTVSIDIAPAPLPIGVTVDGPSFTAPGVVTSFGSVLSGGAGPVTYAWSVDLSGTEVAAGSGTSINFTPTAGGVHTVTVTVTDDTGTDIAQDSLTVLGDVDNSGFTEDIVWLAEAGVTKGCNPPANDEFCPDDPVTRGAMAAFLVRFLGLTDDGGGNSFTDDDGSIFEADIAKLAAAGITKGCNPPVNDEFCPDDPVTRGAMAAFLVRALGLADDGGGNSFTDDDGSIFEADIAKLAAAGIKGCNPPVNDEFCPDDSVTRGQMAAFLNRADKVLLS